MRHALGGGFLACWSLLLFRRLLASERYGRIDLERLQRGKLERLLRTAGTRVPYWHAAKERGGCPLADKTVRQTLAGWPVLTKARVRERPQEFLAPQYPAWARRWQTTGGSTGEPLRVAKSLASIAMAEAALLRGRLWVGVQPGDRVVQVKGFDRASWAGRLRARLMNLEIIDAYDFEAGGAQRGIDIIRRFHPKYITGYPTSLLRLVDAMSSDVLSVPIVFSTGEMLYPEQRERLRRSFGAAVYDYYGSSEVSSIAFECERGVKHIVEEHLVVETLDERGEPVWEEPGRLVLTDLDNLAMPLIRYEVGDVGVLSREPCACGRSSLILKTVEGRAQDALRSRDGRSLPAIFFADRFSRLRSITAYQVVQTDWEAVTVRYVATQQPGLEKELDEIRETITRHLGERARVQTEACAAIPLTARGKTRLVVGMNGGIPAVQ